jgi:DNA-binding transcriptional ArsR family regulator
VERRVELSDARSLRALAHPLRLRLLGLLRTHGPLTATEAGARLGESAGSASFHLRQLAASGLVEEAGRQGRRRPWRATAMLTLVPTTLADPEAAEAAAAYGQIVVDIYTRLLRDWAERRAAEPAEWREASGMGDRFTYLTPEELGAIRDAMLELASRHGDRVADPAKRPPGSRLAQVVYAAIPLTEDDDRR